MRFIGQNSYLSNSYYCEVRVGDIEFNSAEAAFQACRTTDLDKRAKIARLSPEYAIKAGKSLIERPDWPEIKDKVMAAIIDYKFSIRNIYLMQNLQNLEGPIVYENDIDDTYWGVCNGIGDNRFGKILEAQRAKLLDMYENIGASHKVETAEAENSS